MKRMCCLAVLVVLLAGCSAEDRALSDAMAFRDELLSARGCSFQARITADYGDSLYTFGASCQADEAGVVRFEITEPESLSGIAGTLSETGGTIPFADTALCFSLMAEEQVTPVGAPWFLLRTLRSGYITAACMEEDLLHITADDSYAENALTLDIWLREGKEPVRGDILYDGRRILAVDIENFRIL